MENIGIKKSLFWKMIEIMGAQGVNFVIQIILARLLSPQDYGILAIIVVFISLSDIFIQKGFSNALIQKKNVDELDYCTMFYSSLFISVLLYIVIYCKILRK